MGVLLPVCGSAAAAGSAQHYSCMYPNPSLVCAHSCSAGFNGANGLPFAGENIWPRMWWYTLRVCYWSLHTYIHTYINHTGGKDMVMPGVVRQLHPRRKSPSRRRTVGAPRHLRCAQVSGPRRFAPGRRASPGANFFSKSPLATGSTVLRMLSSRGSGAPGLRTGAPGASRRGP